MDEKSTYTEEIERYLEGAMSKEALRDFEEKLKFNEQLAEELDFYKTLRDTIGKRESTALKKQLMEISRSSSDSNTQVRHIFKSYKKYWLAASILVLIGLASVLYMIRSGDGNPDQIFASYYDFPEALIENFRGADQPGAIYTKFKQKDYRAALLLLERDEESAWSDEQVQFYRGLCNIELKQYEEAIQQFERIVHINNGVYQEKTYWYLGLCYLRTGDMQKAKQVFQQISETNSIYKDKTTKILERMRGQ